MLVRIDESLILRVGRLGLRLRQHRTDKVVGRRMNFSSDAIANFEGLLEVSRGICKQQMAEKASSDVPPFCAGVP